MFADLSRYSAWTASWPASFFCYAHAGCKREHREAPLLQCLLVRKCALEVELPQEACSMRNAPTQAVLLLVPLLRAEILSLRTQGASRWV